MVRRSTVDRSPQPVMHSAGFATGAGNLEQRGVRYRVAPGWRGAGGRWLVWVFRAVVWAVLLVIGYRGVTAIVLNETPSSAPRAASSPRALAFPRTLASAFALQFGDVYLNASPATAAQRQAGLAQFLSPGANPQLGWNGAGSLQLQSEEVAGVAVRDGQHAVVTLLARVNGRLMELGVPIYAAGQRMVVSGEPAWLPAPQRASLPAAAAAASDVTAQSQLMSLLPEFFRAYASGNAVTLGRFLVPGAAVAGLNGQVTFGSLTAVAVPPGGTTRDISAAVVWRVPGQAAGGGAAAGAGSAAGAPAELEMTYALTIVKQNGAWYVQRISPSALSTGPP